MADANWSKYDALFRLRGANGSAAFPDVFGGVTLVQYGGAVVSTSVEDPFGQSVGVLNLNSSRRLSVATYAALSGNFSVGGWFRLTDSTYQVIWSFGDYSQDSNCAYLRYSSGVLDFVVGSTVIASMTAPALNTWFKADVSRNGSDVRLLINGAASSSGTNSASLGTHGFMIGDRLGATGTNMSGQVCEFYIANGDCVFWDTYTPATEAIVTPALSGTVKDATNTPCARLVRAHRRASGIVAGSATSDASTGAFSIEVVTFEPHYVVVFDDATLDENLIAFDLVTPM